MKKTIDEILNRDDYARLTSQLKERVEEIAERVHNKMIELDIPNNPDYYDGEIEVDGLTLCVASARSNCGTYEYLAIRNYDHELVSLEDLNDNYYYAGDYYARVKGANNADALRFLNSARKIIEALGEIEAEQYEEEKKALANTENLV